MPQTISDLVKMARHVIATEGLSTVKDVVPANRISYGNSPQKTVTPRIVLEVSGTTYSPTFDDDRKVRTYTVDYAVYSKSVAECTDIMERIQTVIRQHETGAANNGLGFDVRLTDETLQAEVDGVLVGVVQATFQTS